VRIAKIDATEHQIPDHPVKSYPTILFFPAHGKQNPIAYEGDRSVDDFASFVRRHSGGKGLSEDPTQGGDDGNWVDNNTSAPARDEL
jgi:protein disulfide-isomerase A1